MLIRRWPPRRLLWLAAWLLFFGSGLAFLMVIQALDTTFPLVLVSYGAIVSGAFLGHVGVSHYRRPPRRRGQQDDPFAAWFRSDDRDAP